MEKIVDTQCPICATWQKNSVEVAEHVTRPTLVCCDADEGGCGEYFVVFARVEVVMHVTARKIEGA